jgi:hypothetical protein
MRSIEELRQAMRDETRDLAPRATFGQIRQRARRRRFAGLVAFAAAVLVPVGATVTALAGGPAGPSPSPAPSWSGATPAVTEFADGTEFPGTGPVVRTGVAYGTAEELVLRYSGDDMNGVYFGLFNPATSQYRKFEGGLNVPAAGQPFTIMEFEDKHDGIVDYGVVNGTGVRVEVTFDGQHATADTAEIPGLPGATAFWVRRTGIAVGPTSAVGGLSPDLAFTARDATGAVVATGDHVQRSDGAIVIKDTAVQLGDLMPTGVDLAGGGRLVLWFAGDDRAAGLFAGRDTGAGAPAVVRGLGRFARPPFDAGFYGGRTEFDEPGGTKAVLFIYVGPAATVSAAAAVSTGRGSVRWSAHPQLRIAWISGVPAQETWKVTGAAMDAAGNVVAATQDR